MRHTAILILLSLFLASTGASGTEIPFQFSDGFILVKAQLTEGGETLNLLLDSGAGASILSLKTARRLHLKFGERQTVQGVGAEAPAWQLKSVTARAGKVDLAPMIMAVDLSNAEELCRERVDGLLGVDFFADRIVQIDFEARRLRLLDDSDKTAEATRLPIKSLNGIYCVPVGLNGSSPRLTRLDTGCNDALHWVIPRTQSPAPRKQVSIGFINDGENMTLGTVALGAQTLKPVEVSLHSEPLFHGEAGLLGIGILSRYLVTVDSVHRELVLQTPACRLR